MDKLKVIITNDQKAVKIPAGLRLMLRRCCTACLLYTSPSPRDTR